MHGGRLVTPDAGKTRLAVNGENGASAPLHGASVGKQRMWAGITPITTVTMSAYALPWRAGWRASELRGDPRETKLGRKLGSWDSNPEWRIYALAIDGSGRFRASQEGPPEFGDLSANP